MEGFLLNSRVEFIPVFLFFGKTTKTEVVVFPSFRRLGEMADFSGSIGFRPQVRSLVRFVE